MTNTLTIPCGKAGEWNVDLDRLMKHDAVVRHVMYIGLKNMLLDCHANVTEKTEPDPAKRAEAARAIVAKKLEAMYNGQVRVGSAERTPLDPVGAEATRLARVTILGILKPLDAKARAAKIAQWTAALKIESDEPVTEKDVIAFAIAANAAREDVRAKAAKIVAARAEAKASVSVDVESLF